MIYNVELTETEDLALGYISFNQQKWIDNAVHERCRIAIDDIVQIVIRKCLETNTQIPNSKEAMVTLAFTSGWLNHPEPITL
jgi:hypothetical protein